ncbi:MAG: DUF433 domain-containing protein [Bryobacteraceae bacterium]
MESVPGRRSGAWVFRDTRIPVATVFENLEAGASMWPPPGGDVPCRDHVVWRGRGRFGGSVRSGITVTYSG